MRRAMRSGSAMRGAMRVVAPWMKRIKTNASDGR
jgi:hypothetical protein